MNKMLLLFTCGLYHILNAVSRFFYSPLKTKKKGTSPSLVPLLRRWPLRDVNYERV